MASETPPSAWPINLGLAVVIFPPLGIWAWQIYTYLKTAAWSPVSLTSAMVEAGIELPWSWPGLIEIFSSIPFAVAWLIASFLLFVLILAGFE